MADLIDVGTILSGRYNEFLLQLHIDANTAHENIMKFIMEWQKQKLEIHKEKSNTTIQKGAVWNNYKILNIISLDRFPSTPCLDNLTSPSDKVCTGKLQSFRNV